jgi:hypothetical protein
VLLQTLLTLTDLAIVTSESAFSPPIVPLISSEPLESAATIKVARKSKSQRPKGEHANQLPQLTGPELLALLPSPVLTTSVAVCTVGNASSDLFSQSLRIADPDSGGERDGACRLVRLVHLAKPHKKNRHFPAITSP